MYSNLVSTSVFQNNNTKGKFNPKLLFQHLIIWCHGNKAWVLKWIRIYIKLVIILVPKIFVLFIYTHIWSYTYSFFSITYSCKPIKKATTIKRFVNTKHSKKKIRGMRNCNNKFKWQNN